MTQFIIILVILAFIIALKSFKVVTQSEVMIIERVGKYLKTATQSFFALARKDKKIKQMLS